MFLKANAKILRRLTDLLIDRISQQFRSILILESEFILFTPQNHFLLSEFHLVCFHGPDKQGVFCEILYVHFILCVCFECSVAQ